MFMEEAQQTIRAAAGTDSNANSAERPRGRFPRRGHFGRAQRGRGRAEPRPETRTFGAGRDKLRVVVLGGLEEVGRNCTLLEYGQDIIFIDMGLQFPEEDMPGVDYIIPNMSYLRGKERRVRGVIVTHGHYDHIGGIPHTVPQIGNPPIFALPLTSGIIRKRQEDFPGAHLNVKTISVDDRLVLGSFQVEFVHINHSIPDAVGVVVHTPIGTLVHTGDWKFDYTPADQKPADFIKIAQLGSRGVLTLMGDSTNAGQNGHQVSEREIAHTLRLIIEKAQGRVIIGTFASMLSRIGQIIQIAQENGRKVAIDGFSMKTNVEIAKELGYIKIRPGTIIDIKQVDDYPLNKILVLCTGAQGEKNAALMRIANNEHRSVKLVPGDTVVFSSSIIPGNERTVQRLKDTLYRKGAEVIHYQMMDVHAGGHAKNEDIKLMLLLFKPKYYIPIEGNHFLLRENAKVAASIGFPKENIFIADNGQVMEFTRGEGRLTSEKVPSNYVFVDGLGVGDVSEVVLRDRQELAADGMVVVITVVDAKTGALVGKPDIISRGFIQLEKKKELIEQTRERVTRLIRDRDPQSAADENLIKSKIRDDIGQFLFQKTERRPMVLPVVIEV
ncbi:ribonuclease J [Patescibacteria group bacterium]|nr:MAG: ribonuclease J [Patescibacteria group bacterium]